MLQRPALRWVMKSGLPTTYSSDRGLRLAEVRSWAPAAMFLSRCRHSWSASAVRRRPRSRGSRVERSIQKKRGYAQSIFVYYINILSYPAGAPMNQAASNLPHDHNLFLTQGFNGKDVLIPDTVDIETDPYAQLDTDSAIRDYYADNGYVVIRDAIPRELCARAMADYEREVKGFKRPLYRQTASGAPETHRFTRSGHMENSILNVHDLRTDWFPNFKNDALHVLTHESVQKPLTVILTSMVSRCRAC